MAETQLDFLNMSDEEFDKLGPEALAAYDEPAPVEDQQDEDEEQDDTEDEAEPKAEAESEGDTTEDEDTADDEEDTDGDSDDTDGDDETDGGSDDGDDTDTSDDSDSDSGDGDDDTGADEEAGDKDPDADVDYKALYEEVMAPFVANGREMKVETAEDAKRLMQMGANYNKKMQGLKPNLKVLKTLEKAGLLADEGKLNFLLDLNQKNPAAIAKLLQDADIAPLDLDMESGEKYKAGNHSPNDKEMALDSVIDEIRDTPTYNRTLEVVADKWDKPSQALVVESPQLLKVINDHMASGVYELISTEMEYAKTTGKLTGLSDLEAYKSIGDAIEARGGFAHLFKPEQGVQKPPAPSKEPTPKKTAADAKRKDKRRAAAPTKTAVAPKGPAADFNPLAMSDDEFMALDDKYI